MNTRPDPQDGFESHDELAYMNQDELTELFSDGDKVEPAYRFATCYKCKRYVLLQPDCPVCGSIQVDEDGFLILHLEPSHDTTFHNFD